MTGPRKLPAKALPAAAPGRRRVALLGSRKALSTLRRHVVLDGGEVVLELDPSDAGHASGAFVGSLDRLAADDGPRVDGLVVLRAADAFSSVEELLEALKLLDARGIGFESLEEPWFVLRSAAPAPATGAGNGLTAALESRAAHFLDLSIERLEADNRAGEEQRRRQAIQADVGKVVAQLLVLGPYAVAVGIVSQAVLNSALLDPELLVRRLRIQVRWRDA